MTTPAVKLFPWPRRVINLLFLFLEDTDGMPFVGNMRFLFQAGMAFQADINRLLGKKGDIFARMGFVTAQAHAPCYGHMDVILAEFSLVVTVETEIRRFRLEEFAVL